MRIPGLLQLSLLFISFCLLASISTPFDSLGEQLGQVNQQRISGRLAQDSAVIPPGFEFLRKKSFSCGGIRNSVKIYRHEKTGMEFVLVPGGSFVRGSSSNEPGRNHEDNRPRVTVDPFLLCRTECTQKVWDKIGGHDIRQWKGGDLPIERVDWNDSSKWCRMVGLRLPTETEWEYACRAGTRSSYNFGSSHADLGVYAWFLRNSNGRTHPVKEKKPNAFGLFDLCGNVWEWCEDTWHEDYSRAPADGSAWVDPDPSYRIARGGSWESQESYCRSSNRARFRPGLNDSSLGFRPACSLRKKTVMSGEAAIIRTLETLGLSEEELSVRVDRVKIKGRLVPFVGQDAEQAYRRVRIDNVQIKGRDHDRMLTNPHIRSFTVFLNPDSGQVMKVVSNRAEQCQARPFPSVESEERQMRQIEQTFTGVPAARPGVPLMQAIQNAQGWGTATQIIAYYVLEEWSTPKRAARPVWVVHARGIPPFRRKPNIPVDAVNHMRTILNAETGEFISADTVPQPDPM